MSLKITDIEFFHFQSPAVHFVLKEMWCRQTIVRVRTNDPEIHGLGCATFTYRFRAVEAALEHHFKPLLIGQDPRNITDLWQQMRYAGYWRNGPVLNNAISGVDMALWDIKGKLAGMPCYELWGGKCRVGATAYQHVDGQTIEEVVTNAKAKVEAGFRVIRCQLGHYSGPKGAGNARLEGTPDIGNYFEPEARLDQIPEMFAALRCALGSDVGILYDVHERLDPMDALGLAKALEPHRPFFLEDAVPIEQLDWLRTFRQQTATKLAMGELFTHPLEIVPYVKERLFDYLRVHLSCMGGITPMLRMAQLCETFGIRTAWHGPPDLSLVGATAMVHLDLAVPNFGVQEWAARHPVEDEVVLGAPEVRDGVVYPNDRPGWGLELNEEKLAEYPPSGPDSLWLLMRRPDGGITPP